MNRRAPLLLTAAVIVILFLLAQFRFIVREGETVVITSLGKAKQAYTEAGWYPRMPWPIHRKHVLDARLRVLETPFEENLTANGKNLLTGLYVAWQVDDPILFLQRVGTVEEAERSLRDLLRAAKSATVGEYPFGAFVNLDQAQVQLSEMEADLLAAVDPAARERYGISVAHLGLNRIGLPEAVTESVFDRMRAERLELAEQYRSEGEAQAQRIRTAADAKRTRMLAEAEAEARRLYGAADAEAAEAYRELAQDPELALFLRKLSSMERLLDENDTLILSTGSDPFDVLRNPKAVPAP